MIFATDLDRTLIYSIRQVKDTAGLVPVEYKNEQPLSYMSNEAVELFQKLKENPNLIIIPVTARSTEQFRRIQVVQDCPYAILACGAVILKNGKPLPIWQQFVKQIRTSEKENYAFFECRNRAAFIGGMSCQEKINGDIKRRIAENVVANLSVTVRIRAAHYKVRSDSNVIWMKSFLNLSDCIKCSRIGR